jgi:PAS domain S-box-containing protein
MLTKTNITGAKELSPKLEITDELYRSIIHTTPIGYFLSDSESNILDVNDAYCKMIGYSREELLSMTVYDFDIEYNKLQGKDKRTIQSFINSRGNSFEVQHRCKDGQIIDVMVSLKYIDIQSGYYFCFNKDVTEFKKLESEIKKYQENLEELVDDRSKKLTMEIKQRKQAELELQKQLKQRVDFSRALVHELKTPLTSLIPCSEALKSFFNIKQEPQYSYARNIYISANRLSRRVDELLDLAKGEAGTQKLNRRIIDPLKIINETAASINLSSISKDHKIIVEVPRKLSKKKQIETGCLK